ncbi:MAG: hypothetical protein KGY78_11005 [Anaerolineae bacterium]|nr:hypothetical protein [Anaerolineae bacterium]
MRYVVLMNGTEREISVQEHLDLVLVDEVEIQVVDKNAFLRAVDQYLAQRPVEDLLEV